MIIEPFFAGLIIGLVVGPVFGFCFGFNIGVDTQKDLKEFKKLKGHYLTRIIE